MKRHFDKIVLGALLLFYVGTVGTITAFRHYSFHTQAWDLGIFEQSFWNTIHGRVMQNTIEEIPNHLGIHMSPFLFLLVPGYAAFPSPYYLLIVQTLALAAGAIPLYFLTRRFFPLLRSIPALVAGGYLLYPPLHWINGFDFHEIAFFVPLILAALYFLERERWLWAWVFLILAASAKEDAILIALAAGLWVFFKDAIPLPFLRSKHTASRPFWTPARKHGAAIAVVMALYFVFATKVVMPALGGGLLRLDRYAALGSSGAEIIKNFFVRPSLWIHTVFTGKKFFYFFGLFFPLAFLPFASGKAFIFLALPGLAENLLTSYSNQFSGNYQYDAVLVGGLFVSTLYGLRACVRRWPRHQRWFFVILGVTLILGFLIESPFRLASFPIEYFKSDLNHETLRSIARAVPDNASVVAPTTLVPHLAHRERIYMLGTEPFWIDQKIFKPDIVIIDGADLFGFYTPEALQKYADSYAESGLYAITILRDRYFIFTKKDAASATGR